MADEYDTYLATGKRHYVSADLFGVHDAPPFPVGEKRAAADFPDIDRLVGMEIRGKRGYVARLVRLDIAAGLGDTTEPTNPACRAFAYSIGTTDLFPTFDVLLALRGATIPQNYVCGFSPPDQVALADNDLFWLIVDGPEIWGKLGDADVNVAIVDIVALDDDADRGNLYGLVVTATEFALGTSLDTRTGTDEEFRFRPAKKFTGSHNGWAS